MSHSNNKLLSLRHLRNHNSETIRKRLFPAFTLSVVVSSLCLLLPSCFCSLFTLLQPDRPGCRFYCESTAGSAVAHPGWLDPGGPGPTILTDAVPQPDYADFPPQLNSSGASVHRRHVAHRHHDDEHRDVRRPRPEPGLHPDHPGAAEDRTDGGAAHRLPVRAPVPRLAPLGGLPVLRGGDAVVPGGLPHLLHHALVPAAGEDALHQLAADGVLPLLRGERPHLHRFPRRCREQQWSFSAGGRSGVWLHGHLPDGREPVDVLQRGLRLPPHRCSSLIIPPS